MYTQMLYVRFDDCLPDMADAATIGIPLSKLALVVNADSPEKNLLNMDINIITTKITPNTITKVFIVSIKLLYIIYWRIAAI
jgi:hypothetical protein